MLHNKGVIQLTTEDKNDQEWQYCPQCGAREPEGASFCGQCGNPLNNNSRVDKKPQSSYQYRTRAVSTQPGAAFHQEKQEQSYEAQDSDISSEASFHDESMDITEPEILPSSSTDKSGNDTLALILGLFGLIFFVLGFGAIYYSIQAFKMDEKSFNSYFGLILGIIETLATLALPVGIWLLVKNI
jgi:ribosomal protein L40E